MANLYERDVELAKLGVVISHNLSTGDYEIQRIDEPETFATEWGLDFIPPLLDSDEQARKIHNEHKKQTR